MSRNVDEATSLLDTKAPKNYRSIQEISKRSDNSIRVPILFSPTHSSEDDDMQSELLASMPRYRYYYRLGLSLIPDHVVPAKFFVLLPNQAEGVQSQSSIVTIFSIWNTMMGTSILSMPWVIRESGFGLSIVLMIFVATVAFYTAYLVLSSTDNIELAPGRTLYTADFSDACRFYLGRIGEVTAMIFSSLALLGALVVYYVLLCNFLYNTVHNVYNYSTNETSTPHSVILYNHTFTDVLCKSMPPYDTHNSSYSKPSFNFLLSHKGLHPTYINYTSPTTFNQLWSQTKTVPFWLLLIVVPLISIKSPTFFTKFNALGTFSIFYLIIFVLWKSIKWSVHMDFSSSEIHTIVPNARRTFTYLTGVCSLAFFIHNAIHSIVRNQAEPRHNIRDMFIAYVCVTVTYLGVGIAFYITFPFFKDCIEENFLNNIPNSDALAFVGRIALFFQMLSVLPLLVYILRTQFMYFFFRKLYPSWIHVLILHFVLITICVLFSVFMPAIGQIIRFSGALCGLFYIFLLPSLIKILSLKSKEKLTILALVFHIFLIILGVLNFLGQFIPS